MRFQSTTNVLQNLKGNGCTGRHPRGLRPQEGGLGTGPQGTGRLLPGQALGPSSPQSLPGPWGRSSTSSWPPCRRSSSPQTSAAALGRSALVTPAPPSLCATQESIASTKIAHKYTMEILQTNSRPDTTTLAILSHGSWRIAFCTAFAINFECSGCTCRVVLSNRCPRLDVIHNAQWDYVVLQHALC